MHHLVSLAFHRQAVHHVHRKLFFFLLAFPPFFKFSFLMIFFFFFLVTYLAGKREKGEEGNERKKERREERQQIRGNTNCAPPKYSSVWISRSYGEKSPYGSTCHWFDPSSHGQCLSWWQSEWWSCRQDPFDYLNPSGGMHQAVKPSSSSADTNWELWC